MTKPIQTIRDGRLSASIWCNQHTKANGKPVTFHSVTFERLYQAEDGSVKNSTSFSGTELLRFAELSRLAYQRIGELRLADTSARKTTAH